MNLELSDLECLQMAATINAELVQEQQQEIRKLRSDVIRLQAALIGIHKQAVHLPGREAVQSLIDSGHLKPGDVTT